MDDDRWDLINHLFALATGVIEDAAAQAMDGQSPNWKAEDYAARADGLYEAAQKLAALASAIRVIANLKD